MRTSEQTNELVAALAKARPKFGPVIKDVPVSAGQRQYSYAPLKNGIEATCEPLAAHGVVVFQAFDAETSTLITRLAHTSGQWVEAAYPLHAYERPQDYGSQATYARRYSLFALLNLAVEDDDGQAAQDAQRNAHPPAQTTRQAPAITPAQNAQDDVPVFVLNATSRETKTGKPYWAVTLKTKQGEELKAFCFDTKVGALAVEAVETGLPQLAVIESDAKGSKLMALRENDSPF